MAKTLPIVKKGTDFLQDFFKPSEEGVRLRDLIRETPKGFHEGLGQPTWRQTASFTGALHGAGVGIMAALTPRKTEAQLRKEIGDFQLTPEGTFQEELFGTDETITSATGGKEVREVFGVGSKEDMRIDPLLTFALGIGDFGGTGGKPVKGAVNAVNLAQDTTTALVKKYGRTIAKALDDIGDKDLADTALITGGEEAVARALKMPQRQQSAQKVIDSFQDVEKALRQTEAQRTVERSERAGAAAQALGAGRGREAFKSAKGQLKGELSREQIKTPIQFEDQELDDLFDMVKDSDRLSVYERIEASDALGKVLGDPYFNGHLPSERDIALLSSVFGEQFGRQLRQIKGRTFGDWAVEVTGVPRALMASADMSATLRQGLVLGVAHPAKAASALKKQFKYFGNEDFFNASMDALRRSEMNSLRLDSGLELTDIGRAGGTLTEREEVFQSNLAQQIPVAGELVRAGERAFVGYLNQLRATVFDDVAKDLMRAGLSPKTDPGEFRGVANFINQATGRGKVEGPRLAPVIENPLSNTLLFSTRLQISRIQLLNPAYYMKMSMRNPKAAKYAMKTMAKFAGTMFSLFALAKLGGADVESDPRSSDFGKVKFGDTRYDLSAGFGSYLTLYSRLIANSQKSPKTGEVTSLGENEFPFNTRSDVLGRSFRYKLAPVPGLAWDLLDEQNAIGEDLTVKNTIVERLIPLYISDAIEAWNNENKVQSTANLPASFFGIGTSAFGDDDRKPRDIKRSWLDKPIEEIFPWMGDDDRQLRTY